MGWVGLEGAAPWSDPDTEREGRGIHPTAEMRDAGHGSYARLGPYSYATGAGKWSKAPQQAPYGNDEAFVRAIKEFAIPHLGNIGSRYYWDLNNYNEVAWAKRIIDYGYVSATVSVLDQWASDVMGPQYITQDFIEKGSLPQRPGWLSKGIQRSAYWDYDENPNRRNELWTAYPNANPRAVEVFKPGLEGQHKALKNWCMSFPQEWWQDLEKCP